MRSFVLAVGMLAAAGCATGPEAGTAERAGALLASAPTADGQLELRCDPEDAEVSVDGIPRGLCRDFAAGRAMRLSAGMHRVDVKKAGHQPYLTYYQPGGARASLTITLPKLHPADGESR